ncbi:MAG: hypothetical protein ACPG7U_01420 [Holosporaceae bacterium]
MQAAVAAGNAALPPNMKDKLGDCARLFRHNPGPHDHDSHMLKKTRDVLEEIVEVYLPAHCGLAGAPALRNYDDCARSLLAAADRLDTAQNTAANPLPHWGTYRSLVKQRLDHPSGGLNDATHRLLRLCAFFCDNDVQPGTITPKTAANQAQAWNLLIQHLDPTNPSPSAVYNVFFNLLAQDLNRVFP